MKDIFPKVFKGEKTMNYFGVGPVPQKMGRVDQRPGKVLPKIMILGLSNGSSSVLRTYDSKVCLLPPPFFFLVRDKETVFWRTRDAN